MSGNKTKATNESVAAFIRKSAPEKAEDCCKLVEIMEKLSGKKAAMWGSSIIGFGSYHYKYESGREGDMCSIGFSPRKDQFSLYIMNLNDANLIQQLGKIKKGASCIYFRKLSDLNIDILEKMIKASLVATSEKWG